MKRKEYRTWLSGVMLTAAFGIWTLLIQIIDVKPVGPNGSAVGFAALNGWFHQLTGVHMGLYIITDWLGLVPVSGCLAFGAVGLIQWIRRRSLLRVDFDILLLGVYYVIVAGAYLLFEMVPVNYRPVLIEGVLEASYPSSTTLLVLSVMPTLTFQINRRLKNFAGKKLASILIKLFAAFMVGARLVSGVHWLTDIIGAVFLSGGLVQLYKAAVLLKEKKR